MIQAPYSYEQLRTLMHSLLFDLELARSAHLCLGDCKSNVGHLVQLLRDQDPLTTLCLDGKDDAQTVEAFSGDINCRPCSADWPLPYIPDWFGHFTCPNTTKCLMGVGDSRLHGLVSGQRTTSANKTAIGPSSILPGRKGLPLSPLVTDRTEGQ